MNTNYVYQNKDAFSQKKVLNIKELESILKNLKQYEAKIKEIEIQIEEYKDMQGLCLKGINYENIIRTNNIFSKTEMQVMEDTELQNKIELLEYEKRHLERFIKRVWNAIDSLTELEKQIIQKKYIENKIWRYITFDINLEERQCREIKNKTLSKILNILKTSD
ncbi:hypothetical protein [Geosporobacter ferrireducens]|uniref:Sigma factor n=1 Tax=Geosporobacter ferrireducens TaxID=1424294 RepID=A0A1D8GIG3_9FIRM|nr:hypothetical protein [Geosporobacter ferrireducens]AOT70677.1 hypothetical protein Gferi_14495 [Geosporobacter ferrireducens]MTI57476.1 hypothetical protein [Geosporobacter ferrireducens]